MKKVAFLGSEIELHFDMLAHENIGQYIGMESVEAMLKLMATGNPISMMKLGRAVICEGMKCAHRHGGPEPKYKTPEEIGMEKVRFTDFSESSKFYLECFMDFWKKVDDPDEDADGKK